jgi:hypothetical protein
LLFLGGETRNIDLDDIYNVNPLAFFLEKIPSTYITSGGAESIKYKGLVVSLDYLLSTEEMIFLHDVLNEVNTVTEIGAGFGRSAHAILANYSISSYTIIDLPEILSLSKRYLKMVLPERLFSKVNFCTPSQLNNIGCNDLVLNIDSMQEMPFEVASNYLDWISTSAKYFFTKNAMGKYDPQEINLKIKNKDQMTSALKMGLIHDIYSLFDSHSIEKAREKYLSSFSPAGSELICNQRGFGQYLFYELALYKITQN